MNIDRWTIYWFVGLVVAVILHEISHGVVALWFGDDTAKRAGRLTLNPVPHIDPFGSIILPVARRALGLSRAGVGEAGTGEPEPVAAPTARHVVRLARGTRDEPRC